LRGLLLDDIAFNIDLTAQLIRRLASTQKKYHKDYCSPQGYWVGCIKDDETDKTISDGFKMAILEKHGKEWPYETAYNNPGIGNPFVYSITPHQVERFFYLWESLYNNRCYIDKSGSNGSTWDSSPRLKECYDTVKSAYYGE